MSSSSTPNSETYTFRYTPPALAAARGTISLRIATETSVRAVVQDYISLSEYMIGTSVIPHPYRTFTLNHPTPLIIGKIESAQGAPAHDMRVERTTILNSHGVYGVYQSYQSNAPWLKLFSRLHGRYFYAMGKEGTWSSEPFVLATQSALPTSYKFRKTGQQQGMLFAELNLVLGGGFELIVTGPINPHDHALMHRCVIAGHMLSTGRVG